MIFWEKNTWPEIKDKLTKIKAVILPIGSIEQHGPHLPLACDTIGAYKLSQSIASELKENVLVLPPIYYGVSEHHMDFPGTITISTDTLISIVYEIASSLRRFDIKKIIIINGHGGNIPALNIAIRKINENLHMQAILINPWELITDVTEKVLETKIWGHACEFETSIALRIIPEKVVRDKIVDPELNIKAHERIEKFIYPWHTKEITNTGSIGYPSKASYEKGERLYNEMLRKTIEHIKNFIGS